MTWDHVYGTKLIQRVVRTEPSVPQYSLGRLERVLADMGQVIYLPLVALWTTDEPIHVAQKTGRLYAGPLRGSQLKGERQMAEGFLLLESKFLVLNQKSIWD